MECEQQTPTLLLLLVRPPGPFFWISRSFVDDWKQQSEGMVGNEVGRAGRFYSKALKSKKSAWIEFKRFETSNGEECYVLRLSRKLGFTSVMNKSNNNKNTAEFTVAMALLPLEISYFSHPVLVIESIEQSVGIATLTFCWIFCHFWMVF